MSLAKCLDVQRLRDLSVNWMAKRLKLSLAEFMAWVEEGDDRFHNTRCDDSTGKRRMLDVPTHESMRRFKRLNSSLQLLHLHHRCAHGGIVGKSSFTSARRHLGAKCILTTDIKDCFPSINAGRFENETRKLDLPDSLVHFLSRLLLCRNVIPQGCPTSNLALNLFFWRFDYSMSEWCHRNCLSYTRMADDIVVSGRDVIRATRGAARVHREIESCGLEINDAKWLHHGIQTTNQEKLVHAISVEQGILQISRQHRKHVDELIGRAIGACESIQFDSFNACVAYRNQLHGWFHYIGQTQDPIRSIVACAIDICDKFVLTKLRMLGLECKKSQWWMVHNATNLKAQWRQKSDTLLQQVVNDQLVVF